MPSSHADAVAFAPRVDVTEDRMRVQDRTRATRGNNVFFRLNPIGRSRLPRAAAALFVWRAAARLE